MKITDSVTGASCFVTRHKSGLEIRVMEMPDFKTAVAQFGIKYGSVHTHFRMQPDAPVIETPAGIAHFLEHKLFENEDAEVSALFAGLGAYDNAYTAYDRTVYYFHTSRAFSESLALLLDFVQRPCFTRERVAKEQGIIAQEIQETLDSPASELFVQLMEGMYHAHPVRTDVAGTLQSIAQITPELLYQCWQTFYNLHNMVLCCAGNVTVNQVLQTADRLLKPAPPSLAEAVFPAEPDTVAALCRRKRMTVGKQQFLIGFKSKPVSGLDRLRDMLLCSLVIEMLAGDTSALYQRLLTDGLIHDTFLTDCFAGDGWFAVTAEGESDDPQQVLEALRAEIERAKAEGLDEAVFAVHRRAAYGDAIISMNSPEAAADAMMDAYMWGIDSPFARVQLLSELTVQDAQDCLRTRFSEVCLSVIEPTAESNR